VILDPVYTSQKVMKVSADRPSTDAYFMEIAAVVSKRSTCLRNKMGAVLVRDKHILSTGYNGAPRGLPHCSEVGCLRKELKIPSGQRHELCRGAHAEANAIIQAALHGTSTAGSIMYSTHQPCILCAKLIINAQIMEVVYKNPYADELAAGLLKRAGVKLRKFKEKVG
jgi:dCMP deaminase